MQTILTTNKFCKQLENQKMSNTTPQSPRSQLDYNLLILYERTQEGLEFRSLLKRIRFARPGL